MPQNFNNKNTADDYVHILEDVARDAEGIVNKLSACKGGLSDEEKEAQREARWRKFFTKMVSFTVLGISATLAAWEFVNFLYERYEIQKEADEYYEVAQSVFLEENNPEVATVFLDKALNLDADFEYRFFKTYIEGLGIVRTLFNLDRPYSKKELDSAHMLVAEAKLMKTVEPDREEPYILSGQLYAALGEPEKALLELEKAIKINPKNSYAHLRYGVALFGVKKNNEAKKEFDIALSIDDSKWAYLWHGVIEAETSKDFDKARSFYQKALDKDPKFDLALYNLAWSYMLQKQRDYPKAKEHLEQALKINPDYKEAYYAMGMLYGYQDRYEIGKVYMSKAIEKDQEYTTAYKWRAIMQSEMKQYNEAIEDFTAAINISPENIDLYARRAGVYQKQQKVEQAIADLRYALEINPDNKRTLQYLANLYRDAGQTQNAFDYYTKALLIDKANEDLFAERAILYKKIGDTQKALEDLNEAIAISRYKPERHIFKRALLHEEMKNIDLAIKDYQDVVEKDKNNAEAWWKLFVLQKNRNIAIAYEALKRYLELKPQDAVALNIRNKINKKGNRIN